MNIHETWERYAVYLFFRGTKHKIWENKTNTSCFAHTCTSVALFPLHSFFPIHHFQTPPLLLPLLYQHQQMKQKTHWLLPVQRQHCVSSDWNAGTQSVTPSSWTSWLGINKNLIASTPAVCMGESGCKKFRTLEVAEFGGHSRDRLLDLSSSSHQGPLSYLISLSRSEVNVILQKLEVFICSIGI